LFFRNNSSYVEDAPEFIYRVRPNGLKLSQLIGLEPLSIEAGLKDFEYLAISCSRSENSI